MAENVGRRGDSWFYRVDFPPGPDGRRRQRRVSGFATEREARRALVQAKVDIDTGRLRYGARRTVVDLAGEWLEAVRPNRKASTFSNYGWLMRAYVVPRIGSVRLDRLTPADIQKLYSELRSSGGQGGKALSGTQVHNIHGVLHNALSYAVRMGYISRNPAEAIDKPRQDTEERPVYTPDQVRQFLSAAEGDRLRAMWYLVLATGLRRAELAGLRWRDLALDRVPPVLAVRTTRLDQHFRQCRRGDLVQNSTPGGRH
ncbi:MAG: site-specific integrase [Acidimicrobiales bacterium]